MPDTPQGPVRRVVHVCKRLAGYWLRILSEGDLMPLDGAWQGPYKNERALAKAIRNAFGKE